MQVFTDLTWNFLEITDVPGGIMTRIVIPQETIRVVEVGLQGPQGADGAPGSGNAFETINGDTGTAVADAGADTLSVVGTNGIQVAAASTPDKLTIDLTVVDGGYY
jgi:hypothetical protein